MQPSAACPARAGSARLARHIHDCIASGLWKDAARLGLLAASVHQPSAGWCAMAGFDKHLYDISVAVAADGPKRALLVMLQRTLQTMGTPWRVPGIWLWQTAGWPLGIPLHGAVACHLSGTRQVGRTAVRPPMRPIGRTMAAHCMYIMLPMAGVAPRQDVTHDGQIAISSNWPRSLRLAGCWPEAVQAAFKHCMQFLRCTQSERLLCFAMM